MIEQFLEDHFGEIRYTNRGEIKINSPYHDDNEFKFYINPEKGVCRDWKSGEGVGYTLNGFLADQLDIEVDEVQDYIVEYILSNKTKKMPKRNTYVDKDIEIEFPPFYYFDEKNKENNMAYNYLYDRGIPEKNIYKMGFCMEGKYRGRIIIPFYEDGVFVYFTSRDFTDQQSPHLHPAGRKGDKVLNIDEMEGQDVFIFESPLDALMLEEQIGTAIMGNFLSKEQVEKIKSKKPKRIIFVPDKDEPAQKTIIENASHFDNPLVFDKFRGKDIGEARINYIDIADCKKLTKDYKIIIPKKKEVIMVSKENEDQQRKDFMNEIYKAEKEIEENKKLKEMLDFSDEEIEIIRSVYKEKPDSDLIKEIQRQSIEFFYEIIKTKTQ